MKCYANSHSEYEFSVNYLETFTAIEVDSFGHFYHKAKTRILKSNQPVWNESFAIDLESSSTLRLICYKTTEGGDILLGKSSLNVSKSLSLLFYSIFLPLICLIVGINTITIDTMVQFKLIENFITSSFI